MNKLLLVSDALVRALAWALAHSLWQATAVALALLLLLPRLKKAWQRYGAAYAGLAFVFLSSAITFVWHYDPVQERGGSPAFEPDGAGVLLLSASRNFGTGLWERISGWLEMNHVLLVCVWLLGFGFFMLRLAGGLWQVQRLRTRETRVPESGLLHAFDVLRQRLGFSRAVALLESTLVRTPMAIGWLKPMVLLPFGLVNRLTTAEVEAVLAHELAHIARRDWIFNLLQALFESLFYYHPAVWWISSVIRRERENCCDDAALAATGNPLAFAKALVQVQEMAVPVTVLALGLSDTRRRPLLQRVRRILNQPQQRQHQAMEKITATLILLAFLALVGLKANSVPTIEAAFSRISDIPGTLFGQITASEEMPADSLPKPKHTRKITREEDDKRVEAEYQDDKLTRLVIDGKEIPSAEFSEHEALAEELLEQSELPEPAETPEPPQGFWTPPHPEIWTMPASPPTPPQMFEFPGGRAFLPPPPFPGANGPVLEFLGKNSDGNTVITLDNNGQATEVVVKGDEIFVNGKKIEKGEPLNLVGINAGDRGEFFFPEGRGYNFQMPDHESMEMELENAEKMREYYNDRYGREYNEERKRALEESQRDYQKELEKASEELAKSQKYLGKEQKSWEKQQKQWEKQQRAWEKEQQNWERNQMKWQSQQQAWEAKNQAMQEALKRELLNDHLISDPEHFSLELSNQSLKVNKKKQPEELHKKYLELVESLSGQKLNGKGSFIYNISGD